MPERATRVLLSFAVIGASWVVGVAYAASRIPSAQRFEPATAGTDPVRFGDRQEVRLSIVVNARCFASTSDSLQHTWAEVRKAARAAARDQSLDFATLAVATNQDIETGLVLLRRLAPVDEISTGRSWMNHDALDLIASGESESLVVPQLVVSLRSTAVDSSSIRAAPARVIRRFAGLVELKKAAAYFRDGEFSRDVRTVRLISREPRSRLSDPGRVLR